MSIGKFQGTSISDLFHNFLELRKHKNDSIKVKNSSNFEIAALLTTYTGKNAAKTKLEFILIEWSHSYIVFALVLIRE